MKFSYSQVWEDTVRIINANRNLIVAIAGVFIFLPSLIAGYLAPQPEGDVTPAIMFAYMSENWHWMILSNLVTMIGMIAIFLLIFDHARPTVGAAIAGAFGLFPRYFLTCLLLGVAFILGAMLAAIPLSFLVGPAGLALILLIPFLYLASRFSVLGPVVVAERKWLVAAIRRSWELTKGSGWRILGLLLLIVIPGAIIAAVISMLVGGLFLLVAGEGIGRLLDLIVEMLVNAAFSTVIVVLLAALYRTLVSRTSREARGDQRDLGSGI